MRGLSGAPVPLATVCGGGGGGCGWGRPDTQTPTETSFPDYRTGDLGLRWGAERPGPARPQDSRCETPGTWKVL